MKTETSATQVASEELEAPISLNPDQLEAVAGGYGLLPPGTVFGVIIRPNPSPAPTPFPKTVFGFVIRHSGF